MAKKNEDVRSVSPHPAIPIFFADQPAALMLGPHVSRFSFGVEEMDDGDFPRPVVEIAMPTVALLQFVNDVREALTKAEFKKQSIAALEKTVKTIAAGRPVKEEQLVKVTSTPRTRTRALKAPK